MKQEGRPALGNGPVQGARNNLTGVRPVCVCAQHFFALENVELDYFESVAQPGCAT